MKKVIFFVFMIATLFSSTSCSPGYGCGYWSANERIPQEERQYYFPNNQSDNRVEVTEGD